MKISIGHFKAIEKLNDYDLKPLTIISGANSGGKSTLIQLLLVIKQTLENNLTSQKLILNKPYVSLGKYKDIVYEGKNKNNLSWGFNFFNEDIPQAVKSHLFFKKIEKGAIKKLEVQVKYENNNSNLYIQEFFVNWKFEVKDFELFLHLKRERGNKYSVVTNSALFFKEDYSQYLRQRVRPGAPIVFKNIDGWKANISFNKFFPYESLPTSSDPDADYSDEFFSVLSNSFLEKVMTRYFSRVSYLGPLRDEPRSFYVNDDDTNLKIGNKGEYAAHILEQKATSLVSFYKFKHYENGSIEYYDDKDTLESAVNYWICRVFKMALRIKVNPIQSGMMYRIEVLNDLGQKVPINHVGFGVSQILPIVVEGLISPSRSTLILEQPEIHLHPNVQSLLLDFIYSLVLSGKKVIVETHSDHFITRLRRRIAEGTLDAKKVNLTFIENKEYKVLKFTEAGSLEYWPQDFFDQLDKDIRAIVKAQSMKKNVSMFSNFKGGN
ncbi:Protein of unknown function [Paenibacillus sp. UNCCL117]|uniref:DUF3696 domain-containing protein n=1 Tax=unclassified Paenibacillus TaxID=185978 RepID=UPI0008907CA2|nr:MULTISPECIES: DUF3696 domain-containing protein [unclassified Paenibacillus]SDE06816.1 Protein of unknown function [Paenibacillus sp. cl123]SFW59309.1 Protein of unknown function [Paenibacillus sp. UNCCL117]